MAATVEVEVNLIQQATESTNLEMDSNGIELKPIHKSNITPRPMNIVDDEEFHHKYFEHYKCSPIKWLPTDLLSEIQ